MTTNLVQVKVSVKRTFLTIDGFGVKKYEKLLFIVNMRPVFGTGRTYIRVKHRENGER